MAGSSSARGRSGFTPFGSAAISPGAGGVGLGVDDALALGGGVAGGGGSGVPPSGVHPHAAATSVAVIMADRTRPGPLPCVDMRGKLPEPDIHAFGRSTGCSWTQRQAIRAPPPDVDGPVTHVDGLDRTVDELDGAKHACPRFAANRTNRAGGGEVTTRRTGALRAAAVSLPVLAGGVTA